MSSSPLPNERHDEDEDRATPAHDDEDDEILAINVSGKRFQTYRSTLERYPNTLLGDNQKRKHFYNRELGEYFLDRNRSAFNGILHYYQSDGSIERPQNVSEKTFTQEVMFFELDDSAINKNDEEEIEDIEELPSNKWMRKTWVTFEHPTSSHSARVVAVLSVVVILLSIVVFCLETIPVLDPSHDASLSHRERIKSTWQIMNAFCNGWFTFEFVSRLISSPSKMKFLKATLNIIDLISIMPFYVTLIVGDGGSSSIEVLRVVRVIRVVRIFKLTRHSRGLHVLANTIKASFQELVMLVLFLFIGVILFSSSVYYAESRQPGTGFLSIPHAFWWAVVTMTTVGYGDLTPETLPGKLIGALCAISGVLVIALPVPVIVSNFERYYKEEKDRQARLLEREKKQNIDARTESMKDTMELLTQTSLVLATGSAVQTDAKSRLKHLEVPTTKSMNGQPGNDKKADETVCLMSSSHSSPSASLRQISFETSI